MKAEMFTGSKEWLALQTPESSSFASLALGKSGLT